MYVVGYKTTIWLEPRLGDWNLILLCCYQLTIGMRGLFHELCSFVSDVVEL